MPCLEREPIPFRKMGNTNTPIFPDGDAGKILLIGDISKAFLDAGAMGELPCEVHTNMLDAIEAATRNSFSAIAVVMSGLPSNLSSALKALRQSNCDAKIILLAQMYEEPAAIQLVGSAASGAGVADDYLICPIDFSYLVSRIRQTKADLSVSYLKRDMPVQAHQAVEIATPDTIDATMEMKLKIKQLEKLATEDDLTGLKNRRYIWEFSRQIIERARAEKGRVTLLIFDIDNFKHYNDVYSHSAGDEILKQAAILMRRCCRKHDVIGRIGGDEFAVVFWDDSHTKLSSSDAERRSADRPGRDHPREAISVAERFREELKKTELHLLGPEGKGVLTISGGLASFPRDGSTIQELFQQADKALLEAKRSGKNRIYLVGKPQNDIAELE